MCTIANYKGFEAYQKTLLTNIHGSYKIMYYIQCSMVVLYCDYM